MLDAALCTPRSADAVATRVQEIVGILRNDPRCSGAVGLLRDVPTHKADGMRQARRRCPASVAGTLGWPRELYEWDAERDASYHKHSTDSVLGSALVLGNVSFPAQHFWDAIIFDLFFNGAPARPRRFFEAGARDGYAESNTLFYEKHLGWSGTLVEPTPMAKCNTKRNRPRSTVVHGAFCAPGDSLKILPHARDKHPRSNASFFIGPHQIPGYCNLGPGDWTAPCYNWRDLASAHNLSRVDFYSLDIDHEIEQQKLLKTWLEWEHFDPAAVFVECQHRQGCETLLQEFGYHTLLLENSQKRTYYGDVLAWKDTCRAWRTR